MNLYAWLIESAVFLLLDILSVNERRYGWFLVFIVLSLFALIRPLWLLFL